MTASADIPSTVGLNPVSVTELTSHIASLIQGDEFLRSVRVMGEVSNWKRATSGHAYFSLKDGGAAINSVMWRSAATSHTWLPGDGDQVIARGYVDVYPERGVYQLYVNRIEPAGRGQLYAQFEALKERLREAGLFDEERKRPLPPRVERIGVVTSADAAALRDILRVLAVRWPLVHVVVFPTLVQGSEAPAQIVAALANAVEYDRRVQRVDVILLARGGGSMEDLWSFNDERVAHAVAACPIPVISGVGHETDFTIADFVADVRAATPSAAAVVAAPDQAEARVYLAGAYAILSQRMLGRIDSARQELDYAHRRLERNHPRRALDLRRQRLDDREGRVNAAMANVLRHLRTRTQGATLRLAAMDPHNVLRRGYSIVTKPEGIVVMGPDQVGLGEVLQVRGFGGAYSVTVTEGGRAG